LSIRLTSGKTESWAAVLRRVLAGESLSGMTELKGLTFENQITPILDGSGRVTGLVGTAFDITQSKSAAEALRESEERYRLLAETSRDIILLHDVDDRIVYVNQAGLDFMGMKREEAMGRPITAFIAPAEMPGLKRRKRQRLTGDLKPFRYEAEITSRAGRSRFFEIYSTPILYNDQIQGILIVARDITERKQAEARMQKDLQEKTVLLNEVHHRVKNSLQVVASLLSLQSQNVTDAQVMALFEQSRNRILMMASVYERLYHSKNFASIDFKQYLDEVLGGMYQSSGIANRIDLKLDVQDVVFSLDNAIPIALIINELFTNSIKHAFPGNRKGSVEIHFHFVDDEGIYRLVYRDNGVGLPDHVDFKNSESLGLTLVKTLAGQIEGSVLFERTDWTTFTLGFKGYHSSGKRNSRPRD
jgi:PAS domain S-box-containing protein